MHDPDLERRVEEGLAELLDRTDRAVVAPDVEHIHRRAETRTVRGIAVTFAATTAVGLLLGAVVLGVGGVGMNDGPPSGRAAAPPVLTRTGSSPAAAPYSSPWAGAGADGTVTPGRPSPSATGTPPSTAAVPSARDTARPTAGPTASGRPEPEPTRSQPRRSPAASPTVRPTAPPTTTATPPPTAPAPRTGTGATTLPRSPMTLRLAFRADGRDADGCRHVWRIDRPVPAPTPRSVVRTVLDGPSGPERGRGVGSVYGRDGRSTPATLTVDETRRVVTVHLAALSSVETGPAGCRGREIRGPVLDALHQYDPRWTARFTVQGDPAVVTRYVDGT